MNRIQPMFAEHFINIEMPDNLFYDKGFSNDK